MSKTPVKQRHSPCPKHWHVGLMVAAGLSLSGLVGAFAADVPPPAPAAGAVDFDVAMKGLRFDPAKADGNLDAKGKANGLLDADEMALVAAVLNNPTLDLRASGGVDYQSTAAAYAQAVTSAAVDTRRLAKAYPTVATVVAGYALLGEGSFKAFNAMTTAFGAPLNGDYALALQLDRYFSPSGDADGDGASNRAEYDAFRKNGRDAYVRAALDPAVKPAAGQPVAAAPPPAAARRIVGVVLYPGFEVLDVFGPVEMWANEPDFEVVLISETGAEVRSAQGVVVNADYSFGTAPQLDIMMVPGGAGTMAQLENPLLLDFLKRQDKGTSFTTSVCTGSALLARAGLLKGRTATTNKAFFSLSVDQDSTVAWKKSARWVEDGKLFTSSGVSAGTDMALALVARIYGKDHARALARSLEYQWSEDPAVDPFAIP
jgi:putative intracellular protease/amidase